MSTYVLVKNTRYHYVTNVHVVDEEFHSTYAICITDKKQESLREKKSGEPLGYIL